MTCSCKNPTKELEKINNAEYFEFGHALSTGPGWGIFILVLLLVFVAVFVIHNLRGTRR
jgi:hypothetical protein